MRASESSGSPQREDSLWGGLLGCALFLTCASIRAMKSKGYVNPIVVPLVMAVIVSLVLGVFTYIYYNKYNEQKTQVDSLITTAVDEAKTQQAAELEAKFQEDLKNPYEVYTASSEYNAVAVTYPRTWSSYVVAKSGATKLLLDGYFHPTTVPDVRGEVNFALRMTLERTEYAGEVDDYQKLVEKGEIKATAITVNGVKGVRLTGAIDKDINGIMVILPIRDKTLKVWTEALAYAKDFNEIIIPKLTFDK